MINQKEKSIQQQQRQCRSVAYRRCILAGTVGADRPADVFIIQQYNAFCNLCTDPIGILSLFCDSKLLFLYSGKHLNYVLIPIIPRMRAAVADRLILDAKRIEVRLK